MKTAVISKESIIEVCKKIVQEEGVSSLNIRLVAKKANISIGSVYNFFETKTDLVVETIEAIWQEIMTGFRLDNSKMNIINIIDDLYRLLKQGTKKYHDFFKAHSLINKTEEKLEGRKKMNSFNENIKKRLVMVLVNDEKLKENCFNDIFSPERFMDFLFKNLLMLVDKDEKEFEFFKELIKRTIY